MIQNKINNLNLLNLLNNNVSFNANSLLDSKGWEVSECISIDYRKIGKFSKR